MCRSGDLPCKSQSPRVTPKDFAEEHFLDVPGRSVSYALLKSGILPE